MNDLIISEEVQIHIDNYLTAPTLLEHERAELEYKILLGIPSNGLQNWDRKNRIATILNVPISHLEKRYKIYSHKNKEVVAAAWTKIETGDPCLGLGPACNLIRESKDISGETGKNQLDIFNKLVKAYDRRQVIVIDGIKIYKKGRPFLSNVEDAHIEEQETKAKQHGNMDMLPEVTGSGTTSPRTFWFIIRKAVVSHLTSVIPEGVDSLRLAQMIEEFEVDIKIAIEEFQSKVRNERTFSKTRSSSSEISRREIEKACQTLSMSPPNIGKPIDLKKAKKQKKILASAYHPDKTGNDSSDLVREVFEQYAKIEKYSEKYGQL